MYLSICGFLQYFLAKIKKLSSDCFSAKIKKLTGSNFDKFLILKTVCIATVFIALLLGSTVLGIIISL